MADETPERQPKTLNKLFEKTKKTARLCRQPCQQGNRAKRAGGRFGNDGGGSDGIFGNGSGRTDAR
jgi:hypothetical protein